MFEEIAHVLNLIVDVLFGEPEMHNCPWWVSRKILVQTDEAQQDRLPILFINGAVRGISATEGACLSPSSRLPEQLTSWVLISIHSV